MALPRPERADQSGGQAKIQALFRRLAEEGRIWNQDRFKKLETRNGVSLWEFKNSHIRFIGTFLQPGKESSWPARQLSRVFVVAHGLGKKQDRHRGRELDRAVRILNAHVAQESRTRMMTENTGEIDRYARLVRQEALILDVTEALARALHEEGVSRSELARRLGRSPAFVSQVLGGGRNLTLGTVSDIAAALSLRPTLKLSSESASPRGVYRRASGRRTSLRSQS